MREEIWYTSTKYTLLDGSCVSCQVKGNLKRKYIEKIFSGYSMKGNGIVFEKIDKAEKYNELSELHTHILINITCLKEIIDFLLCKGNFQLIETLFQLRMIYGTI